MDAAERGVGMADTNGRIPLSVEGIEKAIALSRSGDRDAYLASLRKRVAAYERQYKMPSAILHEAIDAKRIDENLDVVKWLHAHDSLVSLENGRGAARVEHTRKLPTRPASRRRR